MTIQPASILEQLDEAAGVFVFPMLDNGYNYPGDVSLTIFRDDIRWLMVIEQICAFWPRVPGPSTFHNSVSLIGNALVQNPGLLTTTTTLFIELSLLMRIPFLTKKNGISAKAAPA